jgi:UDP-2,3-diacylglucosamine pyrophosphatase LpxH
MVLSVALIKFARRLYAFAMKWKLLYNQLDELYETSYRVQLNPGDKCVVFSDLHMGNGSSKDDFRRNAYLFTTALEKYYLEENYTLVLNGDVEELQRFSYAKIQKRWKAVYAIFDRFMHKGMLFKTIGNHDLQMCLPDGPGREYNPVDALVFDSIFGELLIFHGHQASMTYQSLNKLVGYTLKYLANPLMIKNYSVAHNSRKQYGIERKVYNYSVFRKRLSIIGHTHRPLFESLSKSERLKFKIEQLCRDYAATTEDGRMQDIRKTIKSHKKELKKIHKKEGYHIPSGQLYGSVFNIPCLFNSGCVIGKRGITCIEVRDGQIALVHWFDKHTSKRYLGKRGYDPIEIDGTDCYRTILNQESLKYIFARIHLLS